MTINNIYNFKSHRLKKVYKRLITVQAFQMFIKHIRTSRLTPIVLHVTT